MRIAAVTVLTGVGIVLLSSTANIAAAADDLRLVRAVQDRADAATVRALIEERIDVNIAQADGMTALALAIEWDDEEIADLLIRAGADVNTSTDYGITPLMVACVDRNARLVDRLLQAGANPNAAMWTGETPIMKCAQTGSSEAVGSLLSHGADPDAKETQQGHTALMRAVAGKHPEVARVLVDHGTDIHARSKGGFTALLFASQQGDLASARILVEAGADVNEITRRGPSARRDTTGGDCVAATGVVQRVTEPRCFVPEENPVPLVLAAASGREAVALYLLSTGADPNLPDAYGWTALHYAVPEGWAAIDGFFYRPIHDDVRLLDMPELVNALLSRGANPNARVTMAHSPYATSPYLFQTNPVGATPLALAAAAGDLTIVRMLLEAGADPTLALAEGSTPFMLAAGVGRTQDLRSQQEEANLLEAVRLLIAFDVDLSATNARGWTALHGAASVGANSIVEFLVEHGADVEAKDSRGFTPLMIASGAGSTEDDAERVYESTQELLLKLGAKPQA